MGSLGSATARSNNLVQDARAQGLVDRLVERGQRRSRRAVRGLGQQGPARAGPASIRPRRRIRHAVQHSRHPRCQGPRAHRRTPLRLRRDRHRGYRAGLPLVRRLATHASPPPGVYDGLTVDGPPLFPPAMAAIWEPEARFRICSRSRRRRPTSSPSRGSPSPMPPRRCGRGGRLNRRSMWPRSMRWRRWSSTMSSVSSPGRSMAGSFD